VVQFFLEEKICVMELTTSMQLQVNNGWAGRVGRERKLSALHIQENQWRIIWPRYYKYEIDIY